MINTNSKEYKNSSAKQRKLTVKVSKKKKVGKVSNGFITLIRSQDLLLLLTNLSKIPRKRKDKKRQKKISNNK